MWKVCIWQSVWNGHPKTLGHSTSTQSPEGTRVCSPRVSGLRSAWYPFSSQAASVRSTFPLAPTRVFVPILKTHGYFLAIEYRPMLGDFMWNMKILGFKELKLAHLVKMWTGSVEVKQWCHHGPTARLAMTTHPMLPYPQFRFTWLLVKYAILTVHLCNDTDFNSDSYSFLDRFACIIFSPTIFKISFHLYITVSNLKARCVLATWDGESNIRDVVWV